MEKPAPCRPSVAATLEHDLDTISKQLRGVEAQVAAKCAELESLSKQERAGLAARVSQQRKALRALGSELSDAIAARAAARTAGSSDSEERARYIAAIERAKSGAAKELVRLLKARHFAGFAEDMVVGDVGRVFLGVRDVWLEGLHASVTLRATPSPVPRLVVELSAPEESAGGNAQGGGGSGALLSVHVGAVRVWGDKGSRVPTMNRGGGKGAAIQLHVRVAAEFVFASDGQEAEGAGKGAAGDVAAVDGGEAGGRTAAEAEAEAAERAEAAEEAELIKASIKLREEMPGEEEEDGDDNDEGDEGGATDAHDLASMLVRGESARVALDETVDGSSRSARGGGVTDTREWRLARLELELKEFAAPFLSKGAATTLLRVLKPTLSSVLCRTLPRELGR